MQKQSDLQLIESRVQLQLRLHVLKPQFLFITNRVAGGVPKVGQNIIFSPTKLTGPLLDNKGRYSKGAQLKNLPVFSLRIYAFKSRRMKILFFSMMIDDCTV